MEILKYPHEALCKVCTPVDIVTPQLKEQLSEMLALMYKFDGVGLAGSQVGILQRVLVMNSTADPANTNDEYVLINPIIYRNFGGVSRQREGCLSMPGVGASVTRSKKVRFEAWTLEGKLIQKTWSGMKARVLQHELEHLNGITIIDHAK